MKTIPITGASSGYGLETARHFHEQGWRVVATMRRPQADLFPGSEHLLVLPLDVTDPDSIGACVAAARPIDVLVNNAGIGLAGAAEATPLSVVRRVFDTNTFGVMAMVAAVLPGMRERGGTIVNVTSSATLRAFPFVSAYTASKTAIEGYSASLALELASFGIRVKVVEPGYGPSTRFSDNTVGSPMDLIPEAYADAAAPVFAGMSGQMPTTTARDVAEGVWQAVHDTSGRLQFPAGADAVELFETRRAELTRP